jgi:hypothetical protein
MLTTLRSKFLSIFVCFVLRSQYETKQSDVYIAFRFQWDVPWLRRLVAGLSSPRPGFYSRPDLARFLVNKVALGEVFLRVLRISPVSITPPMLLSHLHLNTYEKDKRTTPGKLQGCSLKDREALGGKIRPHCFTVFMCELARHWLEIRGSVVNTATSYPGGPVFKLRPKVEDQGWNMNLYIYVCVCVCLYIKYQTAYECYVPLGISHVFSMENVFFAFLHIWQLCVRMCVTWGIGYFTVLLYTQTRVKKEGGEARKEWA